MRLARDPVTVAVHMRAITRLPAIERRLAQHPHLVTAFVMDALLDRLALGPLLRQGFSRGPQQPAARPGKTGKDKNGERFHRGPAASR